MASVGSDVSQVVFARDDDNLGVTGLTPTLTAYRTDTGATVSGTVSEVAVGFYEVAFTSIPASISWEVDLGASIADHLRYVRGSVVVEPVRDFGGYVGA